MYVDALGFFIKLEVRSGGQVSSLPLKLELEPTCAAQSSALNKAQPGCSPLFHEKEGGCTEEMPCFYKASGCFYPGIPLCSKSLHAGVGGETQSDPKLENPVSSRRCSPLPSQSTWSLTSSEGMGNI